MIFVHVDFFLLKHQYKEAEVDLELALTHCHYLAKSNKKRILNKLVPLRLRLGEQGNGR